MYDIHKAQLCRKVVVETYEDILCMSAWHLLLYYITFLHIKILQCKRYVFTLRYSSAAVCSSVFKDGFLYVYLMRINIIRGISLTSAFSAM